MRVSPLWRGAWACMCAGLLAATFSSADEPLDEIVLGARIASLEATEKAGVTTGVATIEVDLRALGDASEVRLRVLERSCGPWPDLKGAPGPGTIEWNDESGAPVAPDTADVLSIGEGRALAAVLRVPLRGRQVHEILLEATGIVNGRAIRTETALRAPLGVHGGHELVDLRGTGKPPGRPLGFDPMSQ